MIDKKDYAQKQFESIEEPTLQNKVEFVTPNPYCPICETHVYAVVFDRKKSIRKYCRECSCLLSEEIYDE